MLMASAILNSISCSQKYMNKEIVMTKQKGIELKRCSLITVSNIENFQWIDQ